MSVSGCICKVIKITALIKPQVTAYCSNPKFGKKKKEKKKESGFNNRKTACVTFDPMSINAGETEVLLPAFYLKQRVFGREVLPMQSELCAASADTGESVHVGFIHMLKMVKDE